MIKQTILPFLAENFYFTFILGLRVVCAENQDKKDYQ